MLFGTNRKAIIPLVLVYKSDEKSPESKQHYLQQYNRTLYHQIHIFLWKRKIVLKNELSFGSSFFITSHHYHHHKSFYFKMVCAFIMDVRCAHCFLCDPEMTRHQAYSRCSPNSSHFINHPLKLDSP